MKISIPNGPTGDLQMNCILFTDDAGTRVYAESNEISKSDMVDQLLTEYQNLIDNMDNEDIYEKMKERLKGINIKVIKN